MARYINYRSDRHSLKAWKGFRSAARTARLVLAAERPIVLMYHRVETMTPDPWGLAVAPDRFARQIAALSRARNIVPMSWLAAELHAGRLPRHVAAITFDDGYADVFHNARPVLEAADCAATVYVTTGPVDAGRGFWWDMLVRIVLETPHLPSRLGLTLNGVRHDFEVAESTGRSGLDRPALLAAIHAVLRLVAPEPRDQVLEELAMVAGTDAKPPPRDRAMTPDEVGALAAGGLIEIGAHSVTHSSLTSCDRVELDREIQESCRRCAELAGRPVLGFAYPFGDFDPRVQTAVRAAGLEHACTVESHVVRRGTDPFAIPRVFAADWFEDDFRREVLLHC